MPDIDLNQPIAPERIAALQALGPRVVCADALRWLAAAPRTYADLGDNPGWAFAAATIPGADFVLLQEVVIRFGLPAQRRRFALLPNADSARLLEGLEVAPNPPARARQMLAETRDAVAHERAAAARMGKSR